ncbi:hypothetical protein Naga_100316g7 [Nannochloropsis gaditana]|uniref:Uncharacterized protein n=1 Tax=Nannochloropsis gaditana TaxID=72520 RepID=W7TRH6_9STRA|nr:hypothetical protein Naga_100316g7 [Nannochloropsis gaditana]
MDALVFADCMRGGQVWRPVKLSCPATLVRLKSLIIHQKTIVKSCGCEMTKAEIWHSTGHSGPCEMTKTEI